MDFVLKNSMKKLDSMKMCFRVELIGSTIAEISAIYLDNNVHYSSNPILYICKNGFVFEKVYNRIKYLPTRLIIPAYIGEHSPPFVTTYKFDSNLSRYNFLRKLKDNLLEFSKSGFFGTSKNTRIVLFESCWYIY